jgi:excinuclease ABC subunit C
LQYLRSQYLSIPDEVGVYLFKSKLGIVIYVGKAASLKKRVSSYFQKEVLLDTKRSLLVSQIYSIDVIQSNSEIEAFLLEATLIKKHKPKYNVRLADGKSYIFLKISTKEEMPRIQFTRREDDLPAGRQGKKSVYFGPYPSFTSLRMVLKTLRRIFPFQSANHPGKRICLYII